MNQTTKVFNYIRGAIRGTYGTEDLRHKHILIVGVNSFGQELINKLCFDKEVHLYFQVDAPQGMQNYLSAFSICTLVEPWEGQDMDIVVDTLSEKLTVGKTTTNFKKIGKDSYTQGIHDFYL